MRGSSTATRSPRVSRFHDTGPEGSAEGSSTANPLLERADNAADFVVGHFRKAGKAQHGVAEQACFREVAGLQRQSWHLVDEVRVVHSGRDSPLAEEAREIVAAFRDRDGVVSDR